VLPCVARNWDPYNSEKKTTSSKFRENFRQKHKIAAKFYPEHFSTPLKILEIFYPHPLPPQLTSLVIKNDRPLGDGQTDGRIFVRCSSIEVRV